MKPSQMNVRHVTESAKYDPVAVDELFKVATERARKRDQLTRIVCAMMPSRGFWAADDAAQIEIIDQMTTTAERIRARIEKEVG